jgi:SSS family solute:Na+ symporter/sodium/proline symporter
MILGVGVVGLRKTRTFSDYFLGGGKISGWMTAFTYGTAYFSAVLFIGFAGKIGWGFGYSSLWIAGGNAFVGVLGVWWLMGHRIKQMSLEYKVSTMSEYFEKRYNSRFLRLFSSIAIFVFFIPYSAAVFIGLSYLFRSNFKMKYWIALLFMGTLCIGVVILFLSTVDKGQGLANMTRTLSDIDPRLTAAVGPGGLWPLFCLVFLTSVAPFAMPQLVQKFYAIKDRRAIRIGMVSSTCFAVIITGVAYFTGAATRLFLSPAATPNAFKEGKPVFDALMPEMLANVIPESLSVLILLLILSASMSTLAALVLISSSAIAKDLYAGFINTRVSDKRLMMLMRACSAFFILVSAVLAYFKPASIVAILSISWGAIGAAFLGPFVWGLLWKRAHKAGAILSSLAGVTTCLVLYALRFSPPEAGTIGMIVSLVVNPAVSLLIPPLKSS